MVRASRTPALWRPVWLTQGTPRSRRSFLFAPWRQVGLSWSVRGLRPSARALLGRLIADAVSALPPLQRTGRDSMVDHGSLARVLPGRKLGCRRALDRAGERDHWRRAPGHP